MDVRVEFVGREISMWRDHVIQRNFISGKDIVDSRSHRSNFNSLLISFFSFFFFVRATFFCRFPIARDVHVVLRYTCVVLAVVYAMTIITPPLPASLIHGWE